MIEIYSCYGCFDGVIYGVGIIEDKFIVDKIFDFFE